MTLMLSPTPGLVGPRARAVHTCAGQIDQMTEETKKVDGQSEPFCQDCRETEMRFHQDDQREREHQTSRCQKGRGGRARTAAGTVPVTVWNGGAGRLALRCSDAASAPSAASRTPSFAPSCGQQ